MKDYFKNLLPGEIFKGDALTFKSSNISHRVPFRFQRLANIFSRLIFVFLLAGFLSGYYPAPSFPPVKRSLALARLEQSHEIIALSFAKPVQLPHPGYLSTRFSRSHPGVDIASGLGMPVRPINPGTVEGVAYSFFGLGNHVTISHENGFRSLYAHLSRVYVKKGDKVSSAKIIGEVGVTGRTSGPHTHLEITKDGQFIDPLTILPELPAMPALPRLASTQARGEPRK